jgi:formylmethanofuran dehydrogenase subunit E
MPIQTPLCGRPLEEVLETIERFHGWKSPGVVIGAYMIDLAQECIGPTVEADAIVESRHCLPDAIQLFTPCTFGNGWMKVLNWDKFALTLYDKKSLEGFRVWLDLVKTRKFPNLYNWYMRLVPKQSLPLHVLLESILEAGRSMLSFAPATVTRYFGKENKLEIGVCSGCGEAYPCRQGNMCLACQGEGYYSLVRGRVLETP